MPLSIKVGINVAGMGGSSFSPLSLSPVVWLKADAGTFQNTALTTPASADDAPVGGWQDQSGQGNHLTQATSTKRPALKLATQNGLPVLRSDGADDFLSRAPLALAQPTTVYLAVRQITWVSEARLVGDTAGNLTVRQRTATPTIAMYAGGAAVAPTTSALAVGTFGLLACVFNGNTNSTIKVNGGAPVAGANTGTGASSDLALGASSNGTSPCNLDMGELLVYSAAHTQAQQNQVVSYMNGRWAAY